MSEELTLSDVGQGAPSQRVDPPAATTTDWTASLDPEIKNHIVSKGLTDTKMLAQSYVGLEKLMSGGPNSYLKIPDKLAETPEGKEAWGKIYDRLGRPQKPEEYGIKVPEGQDATFANDFAKTFHDLGLSKKQVDAITAKWNASAEGVQATQTAQAEKLKADMLTELKTKWGGAFDQNVQIAKKAAEAFPELLNEQTYQELEKVMGPAKVVQLFHAFMSKTMPNSKFESGEQQGFSNGVLSPDQASAELAKLGKDVDFMRRWTSGDIDASAKMDRLIKMKAGFSQ